MMERFPIRPKVSEVGPMSLLDNNARFTASSFAYSSLISMKSYYPHKVSCFLNKPLYYLILKIV